jgi:hypothetical protein
MRSTRRTVLIRFAELVERLEGAGLTVGLERREGRHAITVTDPDSCRGIRLPVDGSFDRAATLLVLSGRLRETLGSSEGPHVSGRWPELLQCWPELDLSAEAA